MKPAAPQAYLKTRVMTASPAELRLMLFDGSIRFAEQACAALRKQDWEQAYEGITRCQAILMELIAALKPEHDSDLCKKLSGLYTFMYTRLIEASTKRDPAIAEEVLKLLRYERATWQMLLDQLAAENKASGSMRETPDVRPPLDPAAPSPAQALVGGSVSMKG